MTWTKEAARISLGLTGLDPDDFDLESVSADLQERTDLSATLDEFIFGSEERDPVAGFDARWSS